MIMFKDVEELKDFFIFCHVHYELFDVWLDEKNKGIFFEGWHDNTLGYNKNSPSILKEKIPYKKRIGVSELFETWKKIKDFNS